MKRLLLLRHAESAWDFSSVKDFDRPLNKVGSSDADLIGGKLIKNKIKIDYMLSSGANRAITTAKIIANCIDYPVKSIEINNDIYHSSQDIMMNVINLVSDTYSSVMIVGHNPTFHKLLESLINQHITNFLPCTIAKINFDIQTWNNINQGQSQSNKIGTLEYLIIPRKDT